MKKTWKRIGSLLLSTSMILTLQPTMAFAEDIVIDETNFPDDNFRTWLINNTDKDMILTEAESSSFVSMNLSNQCISSLEGIEFFINLQELECDNNGLSELPELPTTLTSLNCCNNSLTELPDLPSGLLMLTCDNNRLTTLPELPTGLVSLTCSRNSLTELPVLPSSLTELNCNDNRLTALTLNDSTTYVYIVASNNLMKDENDVTRNNITWNGGNFVFSPQKDSTPPVLSNGSSFRMDEDSGSITFMTDEAGTAYYKMVNSGAAAPAKANIVSGGTSIGAVAAEEINQPLDLTTDAKDIYVVVKDAEGNISDPLKIELAAAPDLTSPVLSNGDVDRTSDTEATIFFTTDEAGTVFYTVVDKDASAPDKNTVAAGASLGTVSTGIIEQKEITLNAGEKDIYVVVEDGANNISDPLKIQVGVYVSPGQTVADEIIALGFSAAVNGSTVTVTGTVTGITEAKSISIPSGVTVKWGAVMSGTVEKKALLTLSNQGCFEVVAGAELANYANLGITIDSYEEGLLLVSDGTILFTGSRGYAISVRDGGICVIRSGRVSVGMAEDIYQLRLDGALAVISKNVPIDLIATDNVDGASAVVRVTAGLSSVLIGSAEGLTVTPYNLETGDSLTTQWLMRSGVVGINVVKNKSSEYWFAPFSGVSLNTSNPTNHGGGGGGSTPKQEASVTGGFSAIKTEIKTDTKAGNASVELSSAQIASGKNIAVTVPKVTGVNSYGLGIPVSGLSSEGGSGSVTMNTNVGNISLPSDMLMGMDIASGSKAQVNIGTVKTADLPKAAQDKVGSHPIVSLSLSIDGKTTA